VPTKASLVAVSGSPRRNFQSRSCLWKRRNGKCATAWTSPTSPSEKGQQPDEPAGDDVSGDRPLLMTLFHCEKRTSERNAFPSSTSSCRSIRLEVVSQKSILLSWSCKRSNLFPANHPIPAFVPTVDRSQSSKFCLLQRRCRRRCADPNDPDSQEDPLLQVPAVTVAGMRHDVLQTLAAEQIDLLQEHVGLVQVISEKSFVQKGKSGRMCEPMTFRERTRILHS
jgi:hypothetical protein